MYPLFLHVRAQRLGNFDEIPSEIVLKDASDGPLDGDECAIQHVRITELTFLPMLHLQHPRLIVCAIGNGHELPVALLGGIPTLQVILLAGCII